MPLITLTNIQGETILVNTEKIMTVVPKKYLELANSEINFTNGRCYVKETPEEIYNLQKNSKSETIYDIDEILKQRKILIIKLRESLDQICHLKHTYKDSGHCVKFIKETHDLLNLITLNNHG